jgi:hypothetical protein
LLITGIQIEEISKLSWLMEFPTHAMFADILYSHHLLRISIWRIFVSFQPTQWHAGTIWIFLEDAVVDSASRHMASGLPVSPT